MAAGAQKVFSLVFQIQAAVGSNFNSSFTSAQNAARKLQNELSGINALQSKVNGYQKQAEVIEKSKEKLAALTEEPSAFAAGHEPNRAAFRGFAACPMSGMPAKLNRPTQAFRISSSGLMNWEMSCGMRG